MGGISVNVEDTSMQILNDVGKLIYTKEITDRIIGWLAAIPCGIYARKTMSKMKSKLIH